MTSFKHVHHLWIDAEVAALDPVGRLIYRSNKLGADQRITNTGGGNTSSKISQKDPLTGENVAVLWVKGSGGDLRTSTKENFASLYQEKVVGSTKIFQKQNTGPNSNPYFVLGTLYNAKMNLFPPTFVLNLWG